MLQSMRAFKQMRSTVLAPPPSSTKLASGGGGKPPPDPQDINRIKRQMDSRSRVRPTYEKHGRPKEGKPCARCRAEGRQGTNVGLYMGKRLGCNNPSCV